MRHVEYVLTRAHLVWNRAFDWESRDSDEDPDDFPGPVGDRHMRALAKPYGRAMGSGIDAVRDTSSPKECHRAADAFAYLGLPDLAEMFRRLADIALSAEDGGRNWPSDQAFWGLENALEGAFERKYAESPEDFEPIPADGVERRHGSWPDVDRICLGELLVHERMVECSRGEGCRGQPPGMKHSRSSLHTDADCDLCPSGPAWPWTS
jgi:hypothetical protein